LSEKFFTDLISVYGPLGLGWPIAFWLLAKFLGLQDRLISALNDSTTAIVGMKTLLDERTRQGGQGG